MTDHSHRADPVLITDAGPSYADELAARKRRYALMMGTRIPLMVAALACSSIPWLAAALLLASIPLPWAAVLIANDRPPRKTEDAHRFRRDRRALETTTHQVIDGPSERDRAA